MPPPSVLKGSDALHILRSWYTMWLFLTATYYLAVYRRSCLMAMDWFLLAMVWFPAPAPETVQPAVWNVQEWLLATLVSLSFACLPSTWKCQLQ